MKVEREALMKVRIGSLYHLRRRLIIDKVHRFILGGSLFTPSLIMRECAAYDSSVLSAEAIASVPTHTWRARSGEKGRGRGGGNGRSGGTSRGGNSRGGNSRGGNSRGGQSRGGQSRGMGSDRGGDIQSHEGGGKGRGKGRGSKGGGKGASKGGGRGGGPN